MNRTTGSMRALVIHSPHRLNQTARLPSQQLFIFPGVTIGPPTRTEAADHEMAATIGFVQVIWNPTDATQPGSDSERVSSANALSSK